MSIGHTFTGGLPPDQLTAIGGGGSGGADYMRHSYSFGGAIPAGHAHLVLVINETNWTCNVTPPRHPDATPMGFTLLSDITNATAGVRFRLYGMISDGSTAGPFEWDYEFQAVAPLHVTTIAMVYTNLTLNVVGSVAAPWGAPGNLADGPVMTVAKDQMYVAALYKKGGTGSSWAWETPQVPGPATNARLALDDSGALRWVLVADQANSGAGSYSPDSTWSLYGSTQGAGVSYALEEDDRVGAAAPTLANVTSSAAGKVKTNGVVARTLGNVTSSAAGKVAIKGAAAPTLAQMTLFADADVRASGQLARTLSNLTGSATASATAKGQLSGQLAQLVLFGVASGQPSGHLAATLDDVTLSSAATSTIEGELARTLGDVTLAAASGSEITGQLAATLGPLTTAPTLDGAWAIATNAVRIQLSAEPMHVSPFDEGDALNPLTWRVTNPTTGVAYTVVGASMYDDETVDLVLLETLGSHLETFRVQSVGLLGAGGGITPDLSALFVGTVQTLDPIGAVTLDRFLDRDLANPPLQSDTGGQAGTLKIGTDGDYETESGIELVRKLALRRLSTPRGAFPHLPRYGVGLVEKEPVGNGNLVALRGEIERQMLQEPDIAEARCGLMMDRSNVLQVQLRLKVARTGAVFDMQVSSANGQLVEI